MSGVSVRLYVEKQPGYGCPFSSLCFFSFWILCMDLTDYVHALSFYHMPSVNILYGIYICTKTVLVLNCPIKHLITIHLCFRHYSSNTYYIYHQLLPSIKDYDSKGYNRHSGNDLFRDKPVLFKMTAEIGLLASLFPARTAFVRGISLTVLWRLERTEVAQRILSNEQNSAQWGFLTFAFINMQIVFFLPSIWHLYKP